MLASLSLCPLSVPPRWPGNALRPRKPFNLRQTQTLSRCIVPQNRTQFQKCVCMRSKQSILCQYHWKHKNPKDATGQNELVWIGLVWVQADHPKSLSANPTSTSHPHTSSNSGQVSNKWLHTWYLSRSPRTCPCKFFLAGVIFRCTSISWIQVVSESVSDVFQWLM